MCDSCKVIGHRLFAAAVDVIHRPCAAVGLDADSRGQTLFPTARYADKITHGSHRSGPNPPVVGKTALRADSRPRRGDGHDGPALKFSEADYRGSPVRRPSPRPEELHRHPGPDHAAGGDRRASTAQYLEAGADIIETNTFGATSVAMADFDLSDRVRELNLAAVARGAARGRRDEPAHARQAPLRRRLDRSDQQAAVDRRQRQRPRLSRRHVRPDGRDLLRAGRGAGRRGRRHPAVPRRPSTR